MKSSEIKCGCLNNCDLQDGICIKKSARKIFIKTGLMHGVKGQLSYITKSFFSNFVITPRFSHQTSGAFDTDVVNDVQA